MKFKSKIRKVGGSYVITLPKKILQTLTLYAKDVIEVKILRTAPHKEEENSWKEYKCLICQHQFSSNDDIVYCSACDNEDSEKIEEVVE